MSQDAGGDGGSHHDTVRSSFEQQAEEFSRSPVMTDAAALARLVAWTAARPGDRVLDVACGPGLVAAALSPGARAIVGIDLTPAMIARGRAVAAEQGARNVSFVIGDVARLPFSDGAFGRVVSRRAFHHFPDPAAVLREMSRVCARGGAVIIEDQAAQPEARDAEAMTRIDILRDPSHTLALAPDAWPDLFPACGLRLERLEVAPREMDFDEWITRAHPPPGDAARARALMEAAADGTMPGPRAWRDGEALRFEIDLQIVLGVKT